MTHEDHSGTLRQGLLIFIVLAFLTFVEFFIAITNQALLLLGTAAIIKAGLVLYYYMHIYKLGEMDDEADQQEIYDLIGKFSDNIGFPVLIIGENEKAIIGFNEEEIRALAK